MQVDWLNSGLTLFPETKDENKSLRYLKYFFWSMGYPDRRGITHKDILEQPTQVIEACPGASGGDRCDKEPVFVEIEPCTKKEV
jgi:hypothetical protein